MEALTSSSMGAVGLGMGAVGLGLKKWGCWLLANICYMYMVWWMVNSMACRVPGRV